MKYIAFLFCFLPSVVFALPAERKDIRRGNKDYKKGDYAAAEIDYRRALDKVAESANAKYNLGNALLKQLDSTALQNPNAKKQLQDIRDYYTPLSETGADAQLCANAHFNIGNTYLLEQDWKKAVEAYKKTLRLNPADMAAKENLVFAQAMSQNPQQQQQQQQNQDNQDKQNDENKQPQDQQKDQQQEQNKQDENQEEKQQDQQQQQEQQPNISKDDAQRMLQAIEQQEKETQDKVKKEKAKKARTRSSDKNW
ncbi:hypothetical protein FACS189452_03040 [Bacteroidia bacterium]|nr:hypothetical protein FACS189452_03040 [Bacteroidia bacterium]